MGYQEKSSSHSFGVLPLGVILAHVQRSAGSGETRDSLIGLCLVVATCALLASFSLACSWSARRQYRRTISRRLDELANTSGRAARNRSASGIAVDLQRTDVL